MSNVAQGGALAAFIIIKITKIKRCCIAAGVSLLGITEPAMFGVNLKLRYPFIGAIIGSAIGSAYISFFKVKAIALGTEVCQDLFLLIQHMQVGCTTL